MKNSFHFFLRRSMVLCLSLLAFASCEINDDATVEKDVVVSTPLLTDFKSAVSNHTRNFYAKNNDTLFRFLPDWTAVQFQQVGNDNASALVVPATLNAAVNGVSKAVAVMADGVLVTVIQVEHATRWQNLLF